MRSLNQASRLFESVTVIPTKTAKNLSLFKKHMKMWVMISPAGEGEHQNQISNRTPKPP